MNIREQIEQNIAKRRLDEIPTDVLHFIKDLGSEQEIQYALESYRKPDDGRCRCKTEMWHSGGGYTMIDCRLCGGTSYT